VNAFFNPASSAVSLTLNNTGSATGAFMAFDGTRPTAAPRKYTVQPGLQVRLGCRSERV
jgi:hypothetical protein